MVVERVAAGEINVKGKNIKKERGTGRKLHKKALLRIRFLA